MRGFTLIELSIVLVIIGLLVGGVLAGQSLIRAAELLSVTNQKTRYVTSVMTFRDKYSALPGDMTNATAFWGEAAAGAACFGTANTGTCNGNGDGIIVENANSYEPYRFWQQLANAGLIEGVYDGINHNAYGGWPGSSITNSPSGRISSSLWYVYNLTFLNQVNWFDGVYGNYLQFGGPIPNNAPYTPIFKPEEAYNIDIKIDDGKPATGSVVITSYPGGIGTCTDTTTTSNMAANYLLSSSTFGCAMIFRNLF